MQGNISPPSPPRPSLLQPRFSKLPWGGQLLSEMIDDDGAVGGGGRGVREVREGGRRVDFGMSGSAKSPVGILKGTLCFF